MCECITKGRKKHFQLVHACTYVCDVRGLCSSSSAVDRRCCSTLMGGSAGAGHRHTPRHQRGHRSRLTPSCSVVQLPRAQSHTLVRGYWEMGLMQTRDLCAVCVCWYTHPCHPPPLYRFQEEHSIMSMVVSNDGTYLLLNLLNQVTQYQTRYTIPANMSSVCSKAAHTLFTLCPLQPVHLWNIKECSFVRRYQGLTQDFYTIHSCFGGPNNSYIASGSEGLLHGLKLG